MAVLTKDTPFYRHDHPRGVLFAAGTAAPDEADGWVTDANKVGEPPAATFECSSFEAYEELLKSERDSKLVLIASAEAARAETARAIADRDALVEALRRSHQHSSNEG